jgi:DNA-binding protein YbaB
MNRPLDDLVARADRALDVVHTASDQLASIRVTHTSRDGVVTVCVDGAGALTTLDLADDLTGITASQLGASIVETAAHAAADALARRHAILDRMASSISGS